jgi:carbon storage regulator
LIWIRRPNESVILADHITVTFRGIHSTPVRLGIDAPRDVVVDRAEVHCRKLTEAATATSTHQSLRAAPLASERESESRL